MCSNNVSVAEQSRSGCYSNVLLYAQGVTAAVSTRDKFETMAKYTEICQSIVSMQYFGSIVELTCIC
jgi:predicted nucleic acid-binding protein